MVVVMDHTVLQTGYGFPPSCTRVRRPPVALSLSTLLLLPAQVFCIYHVRTARRAQRAIAIRLSLGDQLFPTFQARTARFHNFLVNLHTADWEQRCYHPTGLQPVRRFVDLYITELSMHGWDIQSRLESGAHLSPESLPVFLEFMPDLMRSIFHPGPRLPAPLRYRFVLTDRVPHVYDLAITGDRAGLAQGGIEPAHSTCQSDTETFILLMFGRLPLPVALAQGRMRMEGKRESARAFAQWFRGV
jgi:hypothetical protein